MSHRLAAAIVATLLLTPADAWAQSSSLGSLDTTLRRGDRVQVIGRDGAVVEGDFDGVSGGSLRVIRRRTAVELPDRQIARVRRRRHEPDGALFGLGLGAAAGLGFVLISCDASSERADCRRAGSALMIGPSAVAGALIDRALRRFDTILDRSGPSRRPLQVSPIVGDRLAGVAVRMIY
jgi:hypothetical protein